jgi:hypothetical protein
MLLSWSYQASITVKIVAESGAVCPRRILARYHGRMSQTIAIAISNLIFQSRARAVALELGLDVAYADTPPTFAAALAQRPAIVVIDLKELNFDPIDAVTRSKVAGAAVLAFGPHTDAETLRAARAAGADLAVPRSRFKAELPELMRSLVSAPADAAG